MVTYDQGVMSLGEGIEQFGTHKLRVLEIEPVSLSFNWIKIELILTMKMIHRTHYLKHYGSKLRDNSAS